MLEAMICRKQKAMPAPDTCPKESIYSQYVSHIGRLVLFS